MNNNILNYNYDELRVVKSSRLQAKITAYLVSIDWLLCLAFFYGSRFKKKISLDWPLTVTTQPSTSKLSDNSVNYTDYSLRASSLGCYGSRVVEGRSACNYVSEIGKSAAKKSMPKFMLIGGDGFILGMYCTNVCVHSHSFLLCADSQKSDSLVKEEPQGNWR